MSWRVQRERGYILGTGQEVICDSRTEPTFEYSTLETAAEASAAGWSASCLDAGQLWQPYRNGIQVLTDVRLDKEYTDLGIITLITDRVYFLRANEQTTAENQPPAPAPHPLAVAS